MVLLLSILLVCTYFPAAYSSVRDLVSICRYLGTLVDGKFHHQKTGEGQKNYQQNVLCRDLFIIFPTSFFSYCVLNINAKYIFQMTFVFICFMGLRQAVPSPLEMLSFCFFLCRLINNHIGNCPLSSVLIES